MGRLDDDLDTEETEVELQEADVEEPAEPSLVRIRYAGNTYELPEHLADVWAKREEEFQRKLTENSDELGRLRRAAQPTTRQQTQVTADPEEQDIEFFKSPSKVISEREARLKEELKQELLAQQALEEQRKRYWASFYKENPSLAKREKLVQAVVQAEFDAVKDLPPSESRKKIAESVYELIGKPAEKDDDEDKSTRELPTRKVTETRGSVAGKARSAPAAKEPLTISEVLRRRAEERRKAQFKVKE